MGWPWKKDPLRRVEKHLTKRLRRVEQELKALDSTLSRGDSSAETLFSGAFSGQGKPRSIAQRFHDPGTKKFLGREANRGSYFSESSSFSSGTRSDGIRARMFAAWQARQERRRREQERLRNLAMQLRASGSLEDVPLIRYERRVARNRRIGLLLLLGLLGLGTVYYIFLYGH